MAILHAHRHLVLSLLAAFGMAAALACSGGGDSTKTPSTTFASATAIETPAPITIKRSDGKIVTLAKPAERAVSLSPGATEIIYAIGGEKSLIAVDKQADYPPAPKDFPTKVDAFEPNIEAIAALHPDLVIVANDTAGVVGALDRLNIPVLFIDINADILTIEDVIRQLPIYGRITGRTESAVRVADKLTARAKAVDDKLASITTHPSVYHELDDTFFSAADGSFVGNLYSRLNAANIAGDGGGSPYPQLTQEAIIAANPEFIILADESFGVTVDSVKARPGWSSIDAVKNNRIYGIDPDIISRPGPRIVDALEQLARIFYPERFS